MLRRTILFGLSTFSSIGLISVGLVLAPSIPRRPGGLPIIPKQIEASIERLSLLEIADRQPKAPEIKCTHLKNKIGRLKQEIERMKAIEAQLAQQEDTQISLTYRDARSMQGTGKATGTVGYNVQCAVEIKTISSLLTKSPMPLMTVTSS
jgi:hypothetical protein